MLSNTEIIQIFRETILHQSLTLKEFAENIKPEECLNTIELILSCKGKVVISGMGKSGKIAEKIVATLSSTGTPAFFVHPADAYHGDLGMIESNDIAILISYSGETDEVLKMAYVLKKLGIKIISITGDSTSTLAQAADVNILATVDRESCPNNLAPTASTTLVLSIGDGIACALVKIRSFTPLDFAKRHPGGSLGRKLLNRVSDEMHTKNLPFVPETSSIQDALFVMTSNDITGIALVMKGDQLVSCYTDGDMRRDILINPNINQKLSNTLKHKCHTILSTESVATADNKLKELGIKHLVVTNDNGAVVGVYERKRS